MQAEETPQAVDTGGHTLAVEEGLAMQSEYEAESMEVEAPNVTLHTPTSEDDTEHSEPSQQLPAYDSETHTMLKDDSAAPSEHSTDMPNGDKGSAEEVNSIQESPIEEEENEEEVVENVGETEEEEVEQCMSSPAQVAQELEEQSSSPPLVQEILSPVPSPSHPVQEEESLDQACTSEAVVVVSTHHTSTQTGDVPILQTLQSLKDYELESLPAAELIDTQDALYATLGRLQRVLSERLSRIV